MLIVLTYYHPHVSGLTIYAQRLAEGLVRRGHVVTVLASHHEPSSRHDEVINGVRVVRAPVRMRMSKGVIMPSFSLHVIREARRHDVVNVHLPQLEGGLVTILARFVCRRPVAMTYHCDLQLPPGVLNRAIDDIVFAMNYAAATFANSIVAYTRDFAQHSKLLSRFLPKIDVIPPPVLMAPANPVDTAKMRARIGIQDDEIVIGACTRIAAEKGIEHVLEAIPALEAEGKRVRIAHAGQSEHVLGEDAYMRRLQPLIARHRHQITFLGILSQSELAAFYANLDVLVVSSVNSTESFGLVQVEAMLCGTPVVATNLPGVREPVRMTGMGEIVPLREPSAIAEAVLTVVANRDSYVKPNRDIKRIFDVERTLDAYEQVFEEVGA